MGSGVYLIRFIVCLDSFLIIFYLAFCWEPAISFVSLGMIKEVKNNIDKVEDLMLELKAGFITQDQYYMEMEKIGKKSLGERVQIGQSIF